MKQCYWQIQSVFLLYLLLTYKENAPTEYLLCSLSNWISWVDFAWASSLVLDAVRASMATLMFVNTIASLKSQINNLVNDALDRSTLHNIKQINQIKKHLCFVDQDLSFVACWIIISRCFLHVFTYAESKAWLNGHWWLSSAIWRHQNTTGGALIAEGPGHSAKAQKPSAKALPSAALGKEPSEKI